MLFYFLCSCKPRIGGRQCDRCAPGYYRFPDCVPCNCNQGGVTPGVCHPDTGRCLCKVSPVSSPLRVQNSLLHITVCLVFSFSDSRSLFLSLSLVLLPCFVEKRCWCQVRYLSGGFLLFWPLQPSRLYQLLLLRGDWPVSELQQAQGEGVFAFRARARLWMPLEMLCLQSFSGC